eukprot:TRINITY_DN2997_c0_g1_i6.p1 TRINITY_DN2997_c0_g1~~TRINITY_DN2997_c0_g1_i6.p1  ORF type:complete len:120 (+),score=25.61 TRINITY_DN2997_c0_g1_i6:123-482(+)
MQTSLMMISLKVLIQAPKEISDLVSANARREKKVQGNCSANRVNEEIKEEKISEIHFDIENEFNINGLYTSRDRARELEEDKPLMERLTGRDKEELERLIQKRAEELVEKRMMQENERV